MERYRWVVEEPRWSWRLEGAGRRVELERRRWSPGDVQDGYYVYVASAGEDAGVPGLRVRSCDGVKVAQREALSVFEAWRSGQLDEWLVRRSELGCEDFLVWCAGHGWLQGLGTPAMSAGPSSCGEDHIPTTVATRQAGPGAPSKRVRRPGT